jgi:excisionase family DNA binding protein
MTIRPCRVCGTPHQRPQPYCNDCEFMTIPEACKRLHIARPTYYRWVKRGKLRPRNVGEKRVLILRAEVDALLA